MKRNVATGLPRMSLLDVQTPFFRPLWRRVAVTAVCLVWAAIEVANGAVDVDALITDDTEDTDEVLADFSQWMASVEESRHEADCSDHPHAHTHAHTHSHTHEAKQSGIRTFLIELDEPVDRDRFNEFMQDLALQFGENLLRMKGLLNVEDRPHQPAVVHGVQHVFFPIRWLDRWPSEERTTKLVFITHRLAPDAVRARFDSGSSAEGSATVS